MEQHPITTILTGTDRFTWYVRPDGSLCIAAEVVGDGGREYIQEL